MLPSIPSHPTLETDHSKLRSELAAKFVSDPQRAALADNALVALFQALQTLASLGHKFALAHEAIVPDEFPKMLYHSDLGELVVHNADEEEKAGVSGWKSRLAHAIAEHDDEKAPMKAPAPPAAPKAPTPVVKK